MADPFVISALKISGFRAYLEPQTFDFTQKPCLALYGPNATGKSGLVDALEFHLSESGTLERLGAKTLNNFAGPSALKHNLADERGVACEVAMTFRVGTTPSSGARSGEGKRPIAAAAEAVRKTFAVDPIIRGYALRGFVESQTADARYTAVATWLNLGPLVEVQKTIKALRQQVKSAAESPAAFQRLDQALSKTTDQTLQAWSETSVLGHANQALAKLDKVLQFTALAATDPAYSALKTRADDEANRLGLTALKHQLTLAEALHRAPADGDAADATPPLMAAFAAALAVRAAAAKLEESERAKAATSIFADVWEAAQPLFAGDTPPETCPVCDTPVGGTAAGSAAGISQHLALHLGALHAYRAAKQALDEAKAVAKATYSDLVAGVQALVAQDLSPPLGEQLTAYLGKLRKGPEPSAEELAFLREALATFSKGLTDDIAAIAAQQGDATYGKAWALVSSLLDLKAEWALAGQTRTELAALSAELNAQATVITSEIRTAVQALLDTLNRPMNAFYRLIQGEKARPIRLELPPEDEANQQRLLLLIDFATNRAGVQPGGYLSDSQIHSLALAFRFAAIRKFNTGARFLVLDDIVTSYDASHRRALTGLLAEHLGDLQVILVTHDERFFQYLRDQMAPARWRFSRIMRLDADYGPRLSDAQIGDDLLQARWTAGQSAANEMRQAEEEMLLTLCRDFGVSIQIRPLDRPYAYERGELASALAAFLKSRSLTPSLVTGVKNPFLQSLISGTVENFGSHFQDDPNAQGSIGDEQTRWSEFTAFRDQFRCPACDRGRFKRGSLQKPVCAHTKCETPFAFKAAPATPAPTPA
jgi:DNA repair exonuclease SbcCD ATPase subunit